jgi:hypothetical protein
MIIYVYTYIYYFNLPYFLLFAIFTRYIIHIYNIIYIYYIYITNYTTLYNRDKMWWNKQTWGLKHQKGWRPWNDGNWIAGIIPKWAYENSYFFQANLFSLTINKGGNHPCFSICCPFMAWFWFWPLWRDGYGWCFLEINLAIRSKPI